MTDNVRLSRKGCMNGVSEGHTNTKNVWKERLVLFMSENKKEKHQNQEETQSGEKQEQQDKQVEEYGQLTLEEGDAKIHLLNIIGEIEGHECLPSNSKTTIF